MILGVASIYTTHSPSFTVDGATAAARSGGGRRTILTQRVFYIPPPCHHHHLRRRSTHFHPLGPAMEGSTAAVDIEEPEIAKGYTMTQFCDRMVDVFLHEKPQLKDWRKFLAFREEWKKYSKNFYKRCQLRADLEEDSNVKKKLVDLARKVKKVDQEMERHSELLKEIQDNPMDVNAVVARRRKEFTGEFFRHINVVSEVCDGLEDQDAMVRLGAKCLSAVRAYDNAVDNPDMLVAAQTKFDDILNSPSLDVACDKIWSLAKSKELDSSLILLINSSWAAAKESRTMKNKVKDIMYNIYKTTKNSLKSITPKEIKLLKYLLNITDPEERFSALASAFSPENEHEPKNRDVLYRVLLNKEGTELKEVRNLSDPIVIQRLFILKKTLEDEYLQTKDEKYNDMDEESDE